MEARRGMSQCCRQQSPVDPSRVQLSTLACWRDLRSPGGRSFDVLLTTTDGGQTWSFLPIPGLSDGSSRGPLCATTLDCDALMSEPGPGGLGIQDVSTNQNPWWPDLGDGSDAWDLQGLRPAVHGTRLLHRGRLGADELPDQQSAHREWPGLCLPTVPMGGVTWNAGTVPATPTEGNSIGSISCSDPSHCMAISNPIGSAPGRVVGHCRWGACLVVCTGRTSQSNLSTISCPTENDCWVSGSTLPVVGDSLGQPARDHLFH